MNLFDLKVTIKNEFPGLPTCVRDSQVTEIIKIIQFATLKTHQSWTRWPKGYLAWDDFPKNEDFHYLILYMSLTNKTLDVYKVKPTIEIQNGFLLNPRGTS